MSDDFYHPAWLSKPPVCLPNGIQKRPERLCEECHKPLPERRAWHMVAHAGACQNARTKRTAKRANERRKKQKAKQWGIIYISTPETEQP